MIRASQITLLLLLYFAVSTAHRKRFHDMIRSSNQSINPGMGKLDHKLHKLVIFTNRTKCEECKLFEDTIRELKRRMHPWRSLLSIDVMNCQEIPNRCREYRGRKPLYYAPELRYFPANFGPGKRWRGYKIVGRDSKDVTDEVAVYLQRNYDYLRHIDEWENERSLFRDKNKYAVLVFQPERSVIGALTALDMLPYPEVNVRIVEDRDLFENFNMRQFGQTLVVFENMIISHRWTPDPATAEEYVKLLRLHLVLVDKDTIQQYNN